MEIKTGIIAEIIYQNQDNNYTICIVEGEGEQFTAVGYILNAGAGRKFAFTGAWKNHPNYGEQFAFTEYEELMPTTSEGIELFLSSGALKGVGPKVARSIVTKFGDDALKIIEEEPNKLSAIEGIGPKKIRDIKESFSAHREFAEVTLYFSQYGISSKSAMKIYEIYKDDTIDLVKENPYRLVDDIFGIGFRSADKIAMKMGLPENSDSRIQSGIKYALTHFAAEGSTYVPRDILTDEVCGLLEVMSEEVDENILQLVFMGEINIEILDSVEIVLLDVYYTAERSVCGDLLRLCQSQLKPLNVNIGSLIESTERVSGIHLSEEQKRAVEESLKSGVFVLTGGPGTGKTTIINSIMDILKNAGVKTAIAAPTGRAAKRITETTGYDASTIHRLLEYTYSESIDTMRFLKNEEDQLEHDAIIIDEASMIDIILMKHLLKAIKSGSRMIIVGDADQLPSVGAGNVLHDIIYSEAIPSVKLDKIFRQAEESMIVINAHRINRGEYPFINEKDKDFFLLKRNDEKRVLDTILELCSKRLPDYFEGSDPLKDIQVLTPVKKGVVGSTNLNRELQAILNPSNGSKVEKKFGEKIFREGDKVMQIRNNYQLAWKDETGFTDGEGVFNGDVGYIVGIDTDFNTVRVVYDDTKHVEYEFSNLDEVEHAYAVTVHKSQGSEFPFVIMPMVSFPPALATRNLLYTAVTRGSKAVILVGDERRMHAMIDNNKTRERYSGLGVRLKELMSEDTFQS